MPSTPVRNSLTEPGRNTSMVSATAEVAQSVEQGTENPCVAGSIPALGTMTCQDPRLIARDSKAGFLFENFVKTCGYGGDLGRSSVIREMIRGSDGSGTASRQLSCRFALIFVTCEFGHAPGQTSVAPFT